MKFSSLKRNAPQASLRRLEGVWWYSDASATTAEGYTRKRRSQQASKNSFKCVFARSTHHVRVGRDAAFIQRLTSSDKGSRE